MKILVSLYEFTEQGVSLSLQSQYPNSSVDHKLVWPTTRKYPLLIFTKQLPDVAYRNTFEIWEWNISSGSWTKLLDRVGEGEYITNEPYLGERWGGFLTENDKLVIIDMSTWLLTENSLPDEPIGVWGIIGWISDDQGNELLLIDSPSTVLYIRQAPLE